MTMKVMMIGYHPPLVKAMAGYDDLELFLFCDPRWLEAARQQSNIVKALPYYHRSKFDLSAAWRIRREIQSWRPDLLHAFYGRPLASAVLATTALVSAPKLVSYRGIMSTPDRWRDPANRITYLHPRVAAHACISEAAKQGLMNAGIAAEKCMVTYTCIEQEVLQRPGRTLLSHWNIPQNAVVVGTVAHIRPVKGIDLLLKAALQCTDLEDIYWVLIGPIKDRQVERLVRDRRISSRVRCLGYQADAAELVSAFDIFVMPSREEGLCRALLEAMTQQLCPVVSDAGGLPEVVRHQRDGIVFPKEDAGALSDAIRILYADRESLACYARSAQQRVSECFSARRLAERTLALYQHVLTA